MWLLLAAIVVVGVATVLLGRMRDDLRKREAADRQPHACVPCCHCHHHP